MLKDKDIRESLFDYLEIEYGKIRIYEEKMIGKSRADAYMVIDNAIVGIITVDEVDEKPDFYFLRRPVINVKADVSKKLELLWRPELSIIVEKYELPAYKSLSKPALRKKLMEKLEAPQLNESVSEILFERDYDKLLSEINEFRKAKNPRRRGPKKATSVKRVRRLSKK